MSQKGILFLFGKVENIVEKGYVDTSIFSFSLSIFSSPEHKVLMVSFCDRPMSVVHNFFKHVLLLNHWANLDETLQDVLWMQLYQSCSRD